MGSMLPYIAAPWIRHGIVCFIMFLYKALSFVEGVKS